MSFSKNFNLNKIKGYFSKGKIDKLWDKVKNLNKNDILLWYEYNKNKIYLVVFSIISIVLLIFIVKFSTLTYNEYKKLQSNIENISIVRHKNLTNLIQNNNLRILQWIVDSIYIQTYDKYDNTKYLDLYKKITKLTVSSVYKNKDLGSTSQLDKFFFKEEEKKQLFDNQKIKLAINKIDKLNLSELKELNNILIIRRYLSSLPKIKKSDLKNFFTKSKQKIVIDTFKYIYVYEIPAIKKYLEANSTFYEKKYKENIAPYENFLSFIFYPNVNIWINYFSNTINPDIFWSKYLKLAKYIDLNLINYWNKFFTISYSWKLYQWFKNIIESINVNKMTVIKDKNLATIWLRIKFKLDNEKSFYWLISKLTITSNKKNIMLINAFTYYLWNNIKDYLKNNLQNINNLNIPIWTKWIIYQLNKCSDNFNKDCKKLFKCTKNCSFENIKISFTKKSNNIKNINSKIDSLNNKLLTKLWPSYKNSAFYNFIKENYYLINDINKLIWARLYNCIKENWYCWDLFDSNYSQIKNSIKELAWCDKNQDLDFYCKFKFINTFNTNYFIAYTLVSRLDLESYTLLDRLKDVYNNLPPVLQMQSFTFNKNESDINHKYLADVWLTIYYKYLTQDDYNKILQFIWKERCSDLTNNQAFSIDKWLLYINNKYATIAKWSKDVDVLYRLKEIQEIFNNLKEKTKKSDLLNQLLANLEAYRILKEENYCK